MTPDLQSPAARPAKRRDQIAWSRERLLDAAAEVIIEGGYRQATATLIAERAGFSREMVRVRFGSVTELARELLTTQYQDTLLPTDTRPGDQEIDLHRSVQAFADLIRVAPIRTRAALILSFEAATSAPEFVDDVDPWLARVEAGIRGALDKAVSAQAIRPVDTTETAKLLTAAAIGGAYDFLRDPTADPTRPIRAVLGLLGPRSPTWGPEPGRKTMRERTTS